MLTTARIDVESTITDPRGWDEVVAASGGTVFHRAATLAAYAEHPLASTVEIRYLTAATPDGGRAAIPLFLLPPKDPLGVLARCVAEPDPTAPLLLAHTWHWYDGTPSIDNAAPAIMSAVLDTMAARAAETGAQAFGFINIPRESALTPLLRESPLNPTAADARYRLDLTSIHTVDDYLATVPSKARGDLRRQFRRARSAGVHIGSQPATPERLHQVAALCAATATKHGNPTWYEPAVLAAFARQVDGLRLITAERAGEVLAASLSFKDGSTFHNWAGGSVPFARLRFSPYAVLLLATVEAALTEHCTLLEGGRRNDAWKQRLGFTRVSLVSWLARVQ